jgi:hypothetical protein
MFMINHKHWHYDRHWGWQPIKARKLDVLEFIYDREFVTAYDLVHQFEYKYSSARCRLSQLRKEGFIVSFDRGQWCLTDKAYKKLRYHGVLQRKEAEELRRRRRAEGRLWLVDVGGKVRMARNDGELAVAITFQEAKKNS